MRTYIHTHLRESSKHLPIHQFIQQMLLRNNYTSNNKFPNICAFLPGYNRSDWQIPSILYTKAPTLRL